MRMQKSFVCACSRCVAPDSVRSMPCVKCNSGFCLTDNAGDTWKCRSCNATCVRTEMALQSEEKLIKLLLSFEPPDEQTIHSITAVVNQDLGGGRQAQHFLGAWMMLALARHLVKLAEKQQHCGRHAAKAAAVIWRLCAWMQEHVPSCLHLLAMECGIRAVRNLDRAQRHEEAAQLAAAFEAAVIASLGGEDVDARYLSNLTALHLTPLQRQERHIHPIPSSIVVTCDACSARLNAALSQATSHSPSSVESVATCGGYAALSQATSHSPSSVEVPLLADAMWSAMRPRSIL